MYGEMWCGFFTRTVGSAVRVKNPHHTVTQLKTDLEFKLGRPYPGAINQLQKLLDRMFLTRHF